MDGRECGIVGWWGLGGKGVWHSGVSDGGVAGLNKP